MTSPEDREYERIAAEIRQSQTFRITLFTFGVTTSAALVGSSEQLASPGSPIVYCAVYLILAPCIMLLQNYTRSINCQSEYLYVFHKEAWIRRFDRLTEMTIPTAKDLSPSTRLSQVLGLYTTQRALSASFFLIVVAVAVLAWYRIRAAVWTDYLAVYVPALVCMAILCLLKPQPRTKYRELWNNMKNSGPIEEPESNFTSASE